MLRPGQAVGLPEADVERAAVRSLVRDRAFYDEVAVLILVLHERWQSAPSIACFDLRHLNDQLAHDGGGQRLTATLMDYALATAADAPPTFEIHHFESPTSLNPLGAKGAGEGGIMPVHPVIAQAVEDALGPLGARVTRVPVTRADIFALAQTRRLVHGTC